MDNDIDVYSDEESPQRKFSFPISVLFIYGVEFCERFNYYGMQAILVDFLIEHLYFTERNAKAIYHLFILLCYIFPIVGVYISNNYLGQFRTVLFLVTVYTISCFGLAVLASTSLPFPEMMLMLIACGCGGMKPCLQALGANQFHHPRHYDQVNAYFFWFYLTVNVAAVATIFIAPLARNIFGFWVPSLVMGFALGVFIFGRVWYRVLPVNENIKHAVSCIHYALKERFRTREKKAHWLDHASLMYDNQLIRDLKVALRSLILFIPMPLFWTLYFQQWSGWLTMLDKMNHFFNNELIDPDHFIIANPIFVLCWLPLFKFGIFPLLEFRNLLRSPLQRIVAGGILAGCAFIIAAIVALQTEKVSPPGLQKFIEKRDGRILVYNNMDCTATVRIALIGGGISDINETYIVPKYTYIDIENLPAPEKYREYKIDAENSCTGLLTHHIWLKRQEVAVLVLQRNKGTYEQLFDRHEDGYPLLRVPINGPQTGNISVNFYYNDELMLTVVQPDLEQHELPFPNSYDVMVENTYLTTLEFEARSIYVVLVNVNDNDHKESKVTLLEIVPNDRIDFWWLLPQYMVLAAAEVMFAISGMEFAYTQAPVSMKCTMQGLWLFMVAIGICVKYFIEAVQDYEKMSKNFFIYGSIMFVDIAILALLARRYKYVKILF